MLSEHRPFPSRRVLSEHHLSPAGEAALPSTYDTTQDGTADVTYAYDALGRRVSKAIGATTTVYVSALNQEVAEYENGTLKRKYVFGSYIDEPLMMVTVSGGGEAKYYYHANARTAWPP